MKRFMIEQYPSISPKMSMELGCECRNNYISCVAQDIVTFDNHYEYLIFLKQHFLECQPEFLGVIKAAEINSADGMLLVLHVTEETCDPTKGIVACCDVNCRRMFLHNERYYTNITIVCRWCLDEIYRTVGIGNRSTVTSEPVLVLQEINPPDPEDIIV